MRTRLGVCAAIALCSCGGDDPASGPGGTGGGGAGGGGGALPTGAIAGDITHHGFDFDVATGAARSRLQVAVTTPGDCYTVPSELVPSAATIDELPATLSHDGAELTACVDGGVQDAFELATDQLVPEQTFLGLDVGLSRTPNLVGGTFTYLLSWVGGCDHFGPCDETPAALTSFDFVVTHPTGVTALCPGAISAGATETSCSVAGPTLAPTYSAFAVVADSDWVRTPFTTGGGVDMVFYETPPAPLRNALDASAVGAFLDWITLTLGPYPYGDEIRVAGGPTVWLGFEHPANIVLRDDLPSLALSYADGTMHVLMHEVVHQWAGDRTTLAATADFVWKEAISEYLAYVFEDEQGGAGDADATRAYWDAAAQQASYFPRPLDEPTPPVESFYGSVYGPGPMVLFVQLEPWLGRVGVLDAIQLFLADPGARSVSDLQAALEQVAGLDLAAYFDAWVYGTGAPSWPTFTVTTTQVGDQLTVTATFADGQARGCALEIDVHGATESATAIVDFGSAPQNASAQVTVTLSEPLVSYDVDPRHRVIDGNSVAAAATKVWIF